MARRCPPAIPGRPAAGVSTVYQELTLVPNLTIAENIFLGRERGRFWLRRSEMTRAAQDVLDELGVRQSPLTRCAA